jgi:uncharacterized membrane protein
VFISYPELKRILYILQTLLGFVLLAISRSQFHAPVNESEAVVNFIVSLVLFTAGCLCIVFGLDAFLLRGEPEIWK